ncbi:O-methyltransferase [Micromonospora eburnea]|uniref:O-methyltransferase n=1 Tax=Micromonospora eburnea TaxID=227316 RepID=A0A1C6UJ16_9ACTN|nr:O-methyltransferase [Micromonospora eburnea]
MAGQTGFPPELLAYVRQVSLRETDVLRELRAETEAYPMGEAMQVMAEEGQLLALLVSLTGARSVLEIGTFTGYSTLWMAGALPPGGRLVTCDITDRWPAIGKPYWQRAEMADRIDVRIGDAGETLAELLATMGGESFDMVFIDADKANYRAYYESSLALVRAGGLIVVDNTVFFGRVVDSDARDPDTVAVREFNAFLHGDSRVDIAMLSMADGVTLVRKRAF